MNSALRLCIVLMFYPTNTLAGSEKLFPQAPAVFDSVIDRRVEMRGYFERFGAFQRLREDLRNAVKSRATGQFEAACPDLNSEVRPLFLAQMAQGKLDLVIDEELAKTNAFESAWSVTALHVGFEFSAGNFERTQTDLDQIPVNRLSKQMFYKWAGLEQGQGVFVLAGYTAQLDTLAKRALIAHCSR